MSINIIVDDNFATKESSEGNQDNYTAGWSGLWQSISISKELDFFLFG